MNRPDPTSSASSESTGEDASRSSLVDAELVGPEMNWNIGDGVVQLGVYVKLSESSAVLRLESVAPIVAPDILVYWSYGGDSETVGKGLPTDVTLLGSFSGSGSASLCLPERARNEGGLVSFYSLAHGETIGFAFIESWGREQ